jgi:hypothetical protein
MSTLTTVNLDIVGDYARHGYDEFDSKRTLNMYAAVDHQGKNNKSLFTRPGLKEVKTLVRRGRGTGRGRAAHVFDNKIFIVIDDKIYSLDNSFNIVYLGEILTDRGYVGIEDNGTELVFVDGKGGWVYSKDTGVLTKITAPGFLDNPIDITVLAERFIVCQAESASWGISGINDANSWDTLDRAKLTAYPDIFTGLGRLRGLLYLFGQRSVEVWYDSGQAFPFSQQSVQTLDYGCASAGSIAINFERAIWLARYYNGQVSIVMTTGGEPEKISTAAIEEELSLYKTPEDSSAYIFKNRIGYIFYVVNFTEDNRTWMYCLTTQSWSQLSYKDEDRWLPEAYFYYNDKHYVLPYNANSIMELSDQIYDDNGTSIRKMREVGVFSLPNYKNHLLCEIWFDVKSGVGHESGNDDDPLLRLEVSRDGGITYGNQLSQAMGKIGKRKTEVRFFNLGISADTAFRIENYNKIPFVLLGCSLTVGIQ